MHDSPAPSAFPARACSIASEEWKAFGEQTYDLVGHTTHAGHKEGEDGFYQKIGNYWIEGTNTHGIDGRDHDQAWSATFISWVMRRAGALDRFRYSTLHATYISQAIRDFLQKREQAGYWAVRLSEQKPSVGDLVCWARQSGVDYDHQLGGNYAGHSDLVVAVEGGRVMVIGGNVGDSVTQRPLALDPEGFILPVSLSGEILFALMKCRIP
jgi:hypothetical protein